MFKNQSEDTIGKCDQYHSLYDRRPSVKKDPKEIRENIERINASGQAKKEIISSRVRLFIFKAIVISFLFPFYLLFYQLPKRGVILAGYLYKRGKKVKDRVTLGLRSGLNPLKKLWSIQRAWISKYSQRALEALQKIYTGAKFYIQASQERLKKSRIKTFAVRGFQQIRQILSYLYNQSGQLIMKARQRFSVKEIGRTLSNHLKTIFVSLQDRCKNGVRFIYSYLKKLKGISRIPKISKEFVFKVFKIARYRFSLFEKGIRFLIKTVRESLSSSSSFFKQKYQNAVKYLKNSTEGIFKALFVGLSSKASSFVKSIRIKQRYQACREKFVEGMRRAIEKLKQGLYSLSARSLPIFKQIRTSYYSLLQAPKKFVHSIREAFKHIKNRYPRTRQVIHIFKGIGESALGILWKKMSGFIVALFKRWVNKCKKIISIAYLLFCRKMSLLGTTLKNWYAELELQHPFLQKLWARSRNK